MDKNEDLINVYFMTSNKEIKRCCSVKVLVTKVTDGKVHYIHKDKEYIIDAKTFFTSSWRII